MTMYDVYLLLVRVYPLETYSSYMTSSCKTEPNIQWLDVWRISNCLLNAMNDNLKIFLQLVLGKNKSEFLVSDFLSTVVWSVCLVCFANFLFIFGDEWSHVKAVRTMWKLWLCVAYLSWWIGFEKFPLEFKVIRRDFGRYCLNFKIKYIELCSFNFFYSLNMSFCLRVTWRKKIFSSHQ